MPDISLKITRQDDGQFIVERNANSPEKIGKDWSVAEAQISQVFGQYMASEKAAEDERKFAPKQKDLPEDADTTPVSRKHKAA